MSAFARARQAVRDPDHEDGAMAHLAFDGQCATHQATQPLRKRQAKTRIVAVIAGRLMLGAAKSLEQVGNLLGRYADSGILNANEDCCILLRHGQIDKAAMCELSGIAQ